MKINRGIGLLVMAVLFVGGCGEEPDESFPPEDTRPDPEPPEQREPSPEPDPEPPAKPAPKLQIELAWEPCDVGEFAVDCAMAEVPLDWDDLDGKRIDVFVRRVPTSIVPSKGQLWYLIGGPGHGTASALSVAPWYTAHGWDVYLMDYRGVGMSTSLTCGRNDLTNQCLQKLWEEWGEDLRHFSTTGAALDLGAIIEASRKPGEQVMLFGSSYGTFLANRYQHLYPDQADGFLLVGVCPGDGCSIERLRNFNLAVRRLLEGCGKDEFCATKIGEDPWGWVGDLMRRLDEGHCSEFYGGHARRALTSIISGTIVSRELLPVAVAALHRIDRCEVEDINALLHLAWLLWGNQSAPMHEGHEEPSVSSYLFYHIAFSEFWDEEQSSAEYRAEIEALPFAFDSEPLADMKEGWPWPHYETPSDLLGWAPSSVPMLFLNGDLDFQTPIWDLDDLDTFYDKEGQRFLRLPFTGHAPQHECEWRIQSDFLKNHTGPLPTKCLDELQRIAWAGTPWFARHVMGTDDLWSNGSGDVAEAALLSLPEEGRLISAIEHARAELRRLEREGVLRLPMPKP